MNGKDHHGAQDRLVVQPIGMLVAAETQGRLEEPGRTSPWKEEKTEDGNMRNSSISGTG